MTSHSLPEWTQEPDIAVSREWPEVPLWFKEPLRVELRRLNAKFSHLHRKVVREAMQQRIMATMTPTDGPGAWLLRDPNPKGRDVDSKLEEAPFGYPTPWRKD
eukprot:gene29814-6320_t